MTALIDLPRRKIVRTAGFALAGALCAPALLVANAAEEKKGTPVKVREEVTPPEDLMREHGVLDRVLLVYEAIQRRFADSEDVDPALITNSAEIIRDFINDYHEKSEETYVFPRFEKAGKLNALVATLRQQHDAGRRVTSRILQLAPGTAKDADTRRKLDGAIASFIKMYRPHAAREDTELFPKLKDLVSSNEYDAMAEDFEKMEHQMFGDDGFDKMTDRIARLERAIGINDLDQFTPRI